jgi:hypothetical protein
MSSAIRQQPDQFDEAETVKRSEAALKRMLATPHKPHATLKAKKKTSRASRTRAKAEKSAHKARGLRKKLK